METKKTQHTLVNLLCSIFVSSLLFIIFSCKKETNNLYYAKNVERITDEYIKDKLSNIKFTSYYYISQKGNDSNPGSIDLPFKTISKALKHVNPGTCLIIREGVYYPDDYLKTDIDGKAEAYIGICSYKNEPVILDFKRLETKRTTGLKIYRNNWYIEGISIRNAGEHGIKIGSNGNIINNCKIYDNGHGGLRISGNSANNLIVNCDSYRNFDREYYGENADGFIANLDIGTGNIFYGCRAWNNSDDGWDLYGTSKPVVIINCWAFSNGYDLWGLGNTFTGNGNGFKLGGGNNLGNHHIYNCIAVDNPNKGFDQNNNLGFLTIYNNTSYKNGQNFGFWRKSLIGRNIFSNNISYEGTKRADSFFKISETTNSWNNFVVSESDFKSLDQSDLLKERTKDGSLPNIDFLHLTNESKLNNAGTDVGLSFYESTPNLGFFQSQY